MRAAPTKRQSRNRRPVIEALRDRPNNNLINSGFAVMQMAAGQAELVFEVDR